MAAQRGTPQQRSLERRSISAAIITLRNRKEDNTKLGRVQGSEHDSSRAPAREKLEEVVEREEVLA